MSEKASIVDTSPKFNCMGAFKEMVVHFFKEQGPLGHYLSEKKIEFCFQKMATDVGKVLIGEKKVLIPKNTSKVESKGEIKDSMKKWIEENEEELESNLIIELTQCRKEKEDLFRDRSQMYQSEGFKKETKPRQF
jgi:hypothetical protein